MKKSLIQTLIISAFSVPLVYSQTFALNGTIWGLIQQHVKYGLANAGIISWTASFSSGTATKQEEKNTVGQVTAGMHVLQLQKMAQEYLSESLMTQLEVAGNINARALVLQQYLSSATSLMQTLQKAIDQEKTLMNSYKENSQRCEKEVTTLNAEFKTAVQEYQGEKAEQIVQQIVQERTCIAENTVYYKQHLLYSDMLQSSLSTLQKRVNYIQEQQSNIIQYFDIMKPQLLKELYTVSKTLQTNF